MTFVSAPWLVDGARTPAAMGRRFAHLATGGADGVSLPGDLKVKASPVPGPQVTIDPGGFVCRNRSIDAVRGGGESYMGYNDGVVSFTVPATTSAGGATDYLIVRIDDPQFPGTAVPATPATAIYERPSLVSTLAGITYPYVLLAKITRPASTAAITNDMITDMRKLVDPREKTRKLVLPLPTNSSQLSSTGERWPMPLDQAPWIDIPEWATHMTIVATVASMGYMGPNVEGTLCVVMGEDPNWQWRSANTFYDLDAAVSTGQRQVFLIGGYGKLDSRWPGVGAQIFLEARRSAGSGYLVTREGTHMVFDVVFTEEII